MHRLVSGCSGLWMWVHVLHLSSYCIFSALRILCCVCRCMLRVCGHIHVRVRALVMSLLYYELCAEFGSTIDPGAEFSY